MLRIFSKKKYLENGGEFPSFAEECNGRVVEGGVIRGTDYLLSAENEKRWCADYELKEGDKVVLNLPSWEENEAVTYMRKVGCIDDTICVRSNKFLPDFGKSDVAASLSRIERVCDFEAETAQKEPDEAEFSIALSITKK